jgi:hypothetical protein
MSSEPMTQAESFQRGIYPFTVGGVLKLADPMRVLGRMAKVEPKLDELIDRFFAMSVAPKDETPEDAAIRGMALIDVAASLEPAILAGFELKPLEQDGSGVSITEAIEILSGFISWQIDKEAMRQAAEAKEVAAAVEAEARERQAAEAELSGNCPGPEGSCAA